MDTSSIKTADEALVMIEKLKLFIKEDSNKVTQVVPFELYEKNGEYRMITPSNIKDKFYLAGLDGSIDRNFSDDHRTLVEWTERAIDYKWKKCNKHMSIVTFTPIQSKSPEIYIYATTVNSVNIANNIITQLNNYISSFNTKYVLYDIKAYEIFTYEHSGKLHPRMLVPVYTLTGEQQFILTGHNDDITKSFNDPKMTRSQWLDFANEHGWKKTNTKFALVDKE